MPSQCRQYKNLTDSTRKYTYYTNGDWFCDYRRGYSNLNNWPRGDWDYEGWYRVVGPAGSQLSEIELTDREVGICGAGGGGWMTGGHPTRPGFTVTRRMNFSNSAWNNGRPMCNMCHDIEVTNCDGYYVYNLPGIDYCIRYCTQ